MANFADRLTMLMQERELTPQRVADAVGASRSAVVKWLNGTYPRSAELFRLAKYFSVSMDWFMVGDKRSAPSLDESMSTPPLEMPADKIEWGTGLSLGDIENMIDLAIQRMGLTHVIRKAKDEPEMMLTLSSLRARLKAATSERGSKKRLADWLGVPSSSVSAWISGVKEPGGETTLKLLNWVKEWERKNNNKRA